VSGIPPAIPRARRNVAAHETFGEEPFKACVDLVLGHVVHALRTTRPGSRDVGGGQTLAQSSTSAHALSDSREAVDKASNENGGDACCDGHAERWGRHVEQRASVRATARLPTSMPWESAVGIQDSAQTPVSQLVQLSTSASSPCGPRRLFEAGRNGSARAQTSPTRVY
jgi:hypothetical protein